MQTRFMQSRNVQYKNMRHKFTHLSTAFLMLILAACSNQPANGVFGEEANAAVSDSSVIPIEGTSLQPVNINPASDVTGSGSNMANRIIYFDLDSYTIKPEYQPTLAKHASYLTAHPQAHVLIQGSADERGSREYNLALGQKRAEAIKKALQLLGVSERSMEAVSIGEEQPVCTEQEESCWARNRKGELVYSGQ